LYLREHLVLEPHDQTTFTIGHDVAADLDRALLVLSCMNNGVLRTKSYTLDGLDSLGSDWSARIIADARALECDRRAEPR
jgi:hypothetical protein